MVSASINPLNPIAPRPPSGEGRTEASTGRPEDAPNDAFSATLERRIGQEGSPSRTERNAPQHDARRPSEQATQPRRHAPAASPQPAPGKAAAAKPDAPTESNAPEAPAAARLVQPAEVIVAPTVADVVVEEAAGDKPQASSPTILAAAPDGQTGAATAPPFTPETAASIAALIASLAARPTDPAGTLPAGFAVSAAARGLPDQASATAQAAVAASPLAAFQPTAATDTEGSATAEGEGHGLAASPARPEHPLGGADSNKPQGAPQGHALGVDALPDLRKVTNTAPTAASNAPAPVITDPSAQVLQAPAGGALPDAASTVAGAAANPAAPLRAETPVTQFAVHTPAGQRAWAEDVGNRMVWMLGRNDAKAELVLNPAHLGKLEVSIQLNGDQTTAHFVAATSAARDALEQALPRLREVLQQAGINLGEANVSTSSEQDAQQKQGFARMNRRGDNTIEGLGSEGLASVPVSTWIQSGRGVVDLFA